MATTQSTPKPQSRAPASAHDAPQLSAVHVKEDLLEYLACYARQNPGHAALVCLSVGFVLGWKLKPW